MEAVDVLADMAAGVLAQRIQQFKRGECPASAGLVHAQFENSHQEQGHEAGQEVRLDVGFQRHIDRPRSQVGLGDPEGFLDLPQAMVDLDDLGITLPYYVVTVFPEEHIATVWAYKNFYPRFDRELPDLRKLVSELCFSGKKESLALFENDFEPAVFDHFPAVRQVKSILLEAGSIFASLSGSGSAVFGLFEREDEALAAMKDLPETYCKNLTRPGFSMEQ